MLYFTSNSEVNLKNKNASYLSSYDGNKITLITNPDEGGGVIGGFFIEKNKLYFTYVNATYKYQLGYIVVTN
jgi:hypothetical protein